MTAANQLRERLHVGARSRLLTVYLTATDPIGGDIASLASLVVENGADMIELGLPTPSARPRGTTIAQSFARSSPGAQDPGRLWAAVERVRYAVPGTPVLLLIYPQTLRDLGTAGVIDAASAVGADGLVVTELPPLPWTRRVSAGGLGLVPLVAREVTAARLKALEQVADPMTYRALAHRTGVRLDAAEVSAATSSMALSSRRPFLVGFGLHRTEHIAAVDPAAAGVVIGSALIRTLETATPRSRDRVAARAVAGWRCALGERSQMTRDVEPCALT